MTWIWGANLCKSLRLRLVGRSLYDVIIVLTTPLSTLPYSAVAFRMLSFNFIVTLTGKRSV